MKYLFVIGGFSFGGAERVMTTLVNYCAESDEVVFIGLHHFDSIPYRINPTVKVINGVSTNNRILMLYKLRRIIRLENPNVILSFLTHINIATLVSSFGTHIPVVISERNDPSRIKNSIRDYLRKIVYPFASGIVFQTSEARDYFSPIIRNKSIIIPNPVFISKNDYDYISNFEKKEIVTVGRLESQKNYPLLIHAFARLSKKYPDYTLSIFGDGQEKKPIEDLIQSYHLEDRIKLYGTVNNLHYHIRDASCFVLASNYEGIPNALMEAMALGLPCIATDCPVGGPRMLINDKNGILVPVEDVDALTKAIEKVISDESFAKSIGIEARKVYVNYAPSIICNQWKSYLDGLRR